MKIIYSIVVLSLVISLLASCKCDEVKGISDYTNLDLSIDRDGIEISRDELVVRFSDGISESEKEKLRDSAFAIAGSTKKCSCGSYQIEMWKIDTTKIKIEEAKSQTTGGSPGKGYVEGDHQFYFKIPEVGKGSPTTDIIVPDIDTGSGNILEGLTSAPGGQGSRMNFAVVDTGFDFNGHNQMPSFLYDVRNTGMNCNQEKYEHISGWNFVDNNGNIRDSHSDGHGTFVTRTLMRELEDNDVHYSILPIKAFDGLGTGSYWNIVCALNYIKEIQVKNGDMNIVNASFGYDFHRIDEIAKRDTLIKLQKKGILAALIEELDSLGTIVVASAGNDGLDTDEPGNAHFPSGFTAPNLIGVGGYDWIPTSTVEHTVRSISGNYGSVSIDLAAPYKIMFEVGGDNIMKTGTGTSYGTPIVVARIAQIMDSGMADSAPAQKINTFLNSDMIQIHSNFTKKIGGGRYIDSEYQYIKKNGVEVEETGPVAKDNN